MASLDMVKSGFDMEVLLGEGFFGEILLAYRDADLFPDSIELFDDITLTIAGTHLTIKENLKIGMHFNMTLKVAQNI